MPVYLCPPIAVKVKIACERKTKMEATFNARVIRGGSFTDARMSPEAELWTAVIRQAIQDLSSDSPDKRKAASLWFTSTSDGACSFIWSCLVIDVEPTFVHSALERKGLLIERRTEIPRTSTRPQPPHRRAS